MSADGELYVDEECRDAFRKELDEWFGENNWNLDPKDYTDVWRLSEMPDKMEINVRDDNVDDKIIGKVLITNKFIIVEGMEGKYVECEPAKIELLKKI